MAIPTLAADATLAECVQSVAIQTLRDVEIVVIDNSGEGRAKQWDVVREHSAVIENESNAGFGAAVNQAFARSTAPFLAVINDDAIARPQWLESMVRAASSRYEIGMCAPQIRLFGEDRLDSAGMLISRDGSSKQRGHRELPDAYGRPTDVLFPSGCAALYKRAMLEEVGVFDESFFLYCEDTDLGLRARRRMWECAYVPEAVVEHRYSHSSGPASPMKAYYVERNRLRVAVRNLPGSWLAAAPWCAAVRYFWHARFIRSGTGKAAEFQGAGGGAAALASIVLRAHLDLARSLPRLWRERRAIARGGRMSSRQFGRLLRSHEISPKQVASL